MSNVIDLTSIKLDAGAHSHPSQGMCINELASLKGGEKFSDSPACVSPVVRRFTMTLNDRLGDEDRQRLLPFADRMLGTAGDGRDEERIQMCARWIATESALPELLDAAGLEDVATRIREMSPEMTMTNVRKLMAGVREEAWQARWTARERLREKIYTALKEKGAATAAAAATDAAAATAAAAATDAAAATATAAAAATAADAAATDAADATATDAATATATDAAAADAATAAAAAAAAATAATALARGEYVYDAVYKAVKPIVVAKVKEILGPLNEGRLDSALDLLDRMLPTEPVQKPALEVVAA